MNDLSAWLLGDGADRTLILFVLVLARTLPLAWLSPWLGWRGTAAWIRAAVAVTLAAALTPLAMLVAPEVPANILAIAALAVRESLIGASFAVAASVPLYAVGWTGDLIDRFRGGAPSASRSGPTGRPFGILHLSASVVLFVTLGGHRLALSAFAGGIRVAPPGAPADPETLAALGLGAARLVTHALELALAFSLPVILAFVLLELAFGFAARVAPALRLWVEGMSVRALLSVAVAAIGLSALLPHLGSAFSASIERAAALFDLFAL